MICSSLVISDICHVISRVEIQVRLIYNEAKRYSLMILSIAVAAKGECLFDEFFQKMETNGFDKYNRSLVSGHLFE